MINLTAIVANYVKRPKTIKFLERKLDVHITPVHYYSPIPDVRELSADIYDRIKDCPGVDFDMPAYKAFMENTCNKYLTEYQPYTNGGLAQVDAFVLYTLIRERKPQKMVEIGSGDSTKIALAALGKNASEGFGYAMTAIEPYPRDYLRTMDNPSYRLLEKKVQDVAVEEFADADILFIDSSHVSKIGSDVNFEIFEIVPRMKVGALIHWHDIMIPIDYPKEWISDGNMYWNESYIVQSFMMFNQSFRIIWPSKYMQVSAPDLMKQRFPFFNPTDPLEQLSSFWIERIA